MQAQQQEECIVSCRAAHAQLAGKGAATVSLFSSSVTVKELKYYRIAFQFF